MGGDLSRGDSCRERLVVVACQWVIRAWAWELWKLGAAALTLNRDRLPPPPWDRHTLLFLQGLRVPAPACPPVLLGLNSWPGLRWGDRPQFLCKTGLSTLLCSWVLGPYGCAWLCCVTVWECPMPRVFVTVACDVPWRADACELVYPTMLSRVYVFAPLVGWCVF